ncbi:MAG: aspartate--tRNA ligase [Clostridiales bacterium]|nr:aspartate--tRNA ligase [Clostridiales bacterium]
MTNSNQKYGRTDYCGTLGEKDKGREVVLCGWVSKMRDLGGLIFVDLRDREGIIQCVFDESIHKELFQIAFTVRAEYVLRITGTVRERAAKNPKIPTGTIEILADGLTILTKSETPPFEISDEIDVNDQLRLKYRYLDLRRTSLQDSLKLRHKITQAARNYFDQQGFLEIETPMLTKSTPEGARDYLVPSRVHPGKFYALPQSPQQYKQILMIAGVDRYMQVVRCFRDEDLRADRQPEFTQIDLEMSFVDVDDVIAVNEGFLKYVFKEILSMEIELPLPRLTWREAMDRFGSDKPDLRFGLEIKDISDIVKNCGFKVFSGAVEACGTVRLITVPGGASKFTRKEIDALSEFVKTYRAKGLAWYRMAEETTSSFAKFMTPDEITAIVNRAGAENGDLILIIGDNDELTALTALGSLRCEIAKRLGLIKQGDYKLLWVTEFPLLEYNEEEHRYVAIHHPFTAPNDEDIELLKTDPGRVRSKAYDIVLNGTELGGGSIRIHDRDLQTEVFGALGFSEEEAKNRFGHLLEAFKYGAPPHGGLAYGLDRLCMLLSNRDSIRDVIAFPKVQNASELMTSCPDEVDDKQLKELCIKVEILEKIN